MDGLACFCIDVDVDRVESLCEVGDVVDGVFSGVLDDVECFECVLVVFFECVFCACERVVRRDLYVGGIEFVHGGLLESVLCFELLDFLFVDDEGCDFVGNFIVECDLPVILVCFIKHDESMREVRVGMCCVPVFEDRVPGEPRECFVEVHSLHRSVIPYMFC